MFNAAVCLLLLIKLQDATYFDQSEIRFLLESDKMRGVTKLKSKPKIAVKLSSHIKKLPLSNRIIACLIFSP